MALVLKDRVLETCTSPGTGTITLLGAVTGYQAFSTVGNGNTCYYAIADQNGANWECGIGTYSSGTLARTTVLSSSNAGSLTNFSSGTQNVFLTYPSERSVNLSSAALTSGRVAYATTDGLLTDSSTLQFNANGLGIGTAPNTSPGSPYFNLNVGLYGGGGIISAGTDTYFTNNLYISGNNYFAYSGSAYASYYNQTGGIHTWKSSTAAGTGGNVATLNTLMTLDASGSLALGSTTVASSNGGMTITCTSSGSSSAPLTLRNAGTANGSGVYLIYRGVTNTGAENDYGYFNMVADDTTAKTSSMRFSTANGSSPVERMRITSGGSVGIGTSSPVAPLNIVGQTTSTSTPILYLQQGGSSPNYGYAFKIDNVTTGNLYLNRYDNPNTDIGTLLTVTTTGSVGIGTTSPADTNNFGRALDIQSSTGAAAYFRDSDDATKYNVAGFFGGDSNGYFGTWGTGTGILFFSSGAERMRITSAGNVGIGTSSPVTRLQLGDGSSGQLKFRIHRGAGTDYTDYFSDTGSTIVDTVGGGSFILRFSGTEKIQVTAAGDLLLGTTIAQSLVTLRKDTTAGTISGTPSIMLTNSNSANSTYMLGGLFTSGYRDIYGATPVVPAGVWFEKQPFAGGASTDGAIVFGTCGGDVALPNTLPAERMRITRDGLVVIRGAGNEVLALNKSGGASAYLQPVSNTDASLQIKDSGGTVTLTVGTSSTTVALQGGTVSSGTGITFPSSQNASSNANTLDDYEEGTWTPVWTGSISGSGSPGTITGTYVKVGKIVTIAVAMNDANPFITFSGSLRCSLPFPGGGPSASQYIGPPIYFYNGAQWNTGATTAGITPTTFYNVNYMEFVYMLVNGDRQNSVTNTSSVGLSSGSNVYARFSMTYIALD